MLGQTNALGIGLALIFSLPLTTDSSFSTGGRRLIAQEAPITINGQLIENQSQVIDGHYFETHAITGKEGDKIAIEMVSDDFDAYLRLFGPNNTEIASDDDAAGRQDAQLVITLPLTGTYQIIAAANYENTDGAYTLSVRPASTDDFVRNEAIRKAYDLNLTINQLLSEARYAEVIPLANEALSIRRDFFGENHPDVADILNNLAVAYQWQGEHDQAESLHRQALTMRRETAGERHRSVAHSLQGLGTLYKIQGKYAEAETYLTEALSIRRETDVAFPQYLGGNATELASVYALQGKYGNAETLHREALSIYQNASDDYRSLVATSLTNIAAVYQLQNLYEDAEALLVEAKNIYEEELGKNSPQIAVINNSLASVYQEQQKYDEAVELLNQSLNIFNSLELTGAQNLYKSVTLNNLASVYQSQGAYAQSESLLIESLEISQKYLDKGHPDLVSALNNLALVYLKQQKFGQAEEIFQRNLETDLRIFGNQGPQIAISYSNLAAVYEAQGNVDEALTSMKSALDTQEASLALNLARLTDSQRQLFADGVSTTTHQTVSLHFKTAPSSQNAERLALTTVLRRKGRIIDSNTDSLNVLRKNLRTQDQILLDELSDIRRQLSNLIFNRPNEITTDQYREGIRQLEAESREIESILAQRSAVFRNETQPTEISDVQSLLPERSVLIEYVRYRPFEATGGIEQFNLNQYQYAAYLLFPDGRIHSVDLGKATGIEEQIQALADSLSDPNQPLRTIQQQARNLESIILEPLRSELEGVDRLLISPDGALNLLPFEALLSANDRYLVQDFTVSYLNSGREITRIGLVPSSNSDPVIIAAPRYGQVAQSKADKEKEDVRSVDLASLTVSPLTWTVQEGRVLSDLIPESTLLVGADATEASLKQVSAPSILHIATHGIFLPEASARTFDSSEAPRAHEISIENPLLRSMLALADFNSRGRDDSPEDGVFTALEASELNLSGTELVTLSACDTGQGEVISGEGVYGLRRSFVIAGAESLLMSLWQVEDEGTSTFMQRYYENLLDGMGRSEALRELQLEMISAEDPSESHPYRWASFVLTGDWQPLKLN